ncbi:MAG: isoprenylcysteine carboxylmethyltransferase family protein [Rhodospirillales bacterium]|nr:isoprenylcysteine carboxylmethyltransferase family protein [Rhodospirillales bacterium]MSP80058.1 isoprenylcysteine carboxylmethyltransferase family protein [Rhodospirillales bacterium]
MSSPALHLLYAALWLSFGFGHSILADARVKARLKPFFGAGYRLAYNLFAAVHVLGAIGAGWWLFGDGAAFDRPSSLRVVQGTASVIGAGVLLAALFHYDLGRFAGSAQLRASAQGKFLDDEEPLRLGGLHRYVRHPIYAGAFLLLWGRVGDEFTLATALWASLYLWIGSRHEDRRLIARFGAAYARYRDAVPAFLPWKGKAWRE